MNCLDNYHFTDNIHTSKSLATLSVPPIGHALQKPRDKTQSTILACCGFVAILASPLADSIGKQISINNMLAEDVLRKDRRAAVQPWLDWIYVRQGCSSLQSSLRAVYYGICQRIRRAAIALWLITFQCKVPIHSRSWFRAARQLCSIESTTSLGWLRSRRPMAMFSLIAFLVQCPNRWYDVFAFIAVMTLVRRTIFTIITCALLGRSISEPPAASATLQCRCR